MPYIAFTSVVVILVIILLVDTLLKKKEKKKKNCQSIESIRPYGGEINLPSVVQKKGLTDKKEAGEPNRQVCDAHATSKSEFRIKPHFRFIFFLPLSLSLALSLSLLFPAAEQTLSNVQCHPTEGPFQLRWLSLARAAVWTGHSTHLLTDVF